MTVTGLIGRICMFPLRAIIATCVALRIHPNILTFVEQIRSAKPTGVKGNYVKSITISGTMTPGVKVTL